MKFSHNTLSGLSLSFFFRLVVSATMLMVLWTFSKCTSRRSDETPATGAVEKFREARIFLLRGKQDAKSYSGTLVLNKGNDNEWIAFRNTRYLGDSTSAPERWSGKAILDETSLKITFAAQGGKPQATANYVLGGSGIEGTFAIANQAVLQESGTLLGFELPPEVKEEILNILASVNSVIRRAINEAENGNWDEAGDATGLAIGLKLHALYPVPGININNTDMLLPFYVVYRSFNKVDNLIERLTIDSNLLWGEDARVLDMAGPGAQQDVEQRMAANIQKLREAIDEIREMQNLPWAAGSAGAGKLDDLADRLEEIKRKMENNEPLRERPDSDIEQIRALKKGFLDAVSDAVPLWDLYEFFREIDKKLESALHDIRSGNTKGRSGRLVINWLKLAEEIKRKQERLIERIPEAPDYPPGWDDLPPFPPDDHA